MRGRWHGEAVTDEVEAVASMRRGPPHQSPAAAASPHRGSLWGAQPQASPFREGGTAQPRRRGRFEFVTTSQSAFGCQLPCKGSLWPAAAGSPLRPFGPAPLDKGSLGACKFIKPPRKKVQSDKLRLHLLFAANIQRQRLIKLIPTYQAARTKTPVR